MSEKVILYHGTPFLESILKNGSIDCRNKQDGLKEGDCQKSYDAICSELGGFVKKHYQGDALDKQKTTNEMYAIWSCSLVNSLELFGFKDYSKLSDNNLQEICSKEEYIHFRSLVLPFLESASSNHVYLGKDMETSHCYMRKMEEQIKNPIYTIFELKLPRNDVKECFEHPLVWWNIPLTQENVVAVHIKNDFERAETIMKKYLKDTEVKRY